MRGKNIEKQRIIPRRGTAGFTLVEVMVAAGIFMLVVGMIFGVLSGGRRAWLTSEAQIDLHQQARQAMQRITDELVESGPGTVSILTVSADEDRLIFRPPLSFSGGVITWGDQIQFSLGGDTGEQLVRTNLATGQAEIFHNYITQLHFQQLAADLYEVVLVLQRQSLLGETLQLQLSTQVALRNR
ncbi:MAG: prepilin-type N-terminal cleavage/methylation domain-containing protein [Candidatus Omnitrophica bacterium]|nr:prepilin-type N-terminal cleavage/methylation domain-containing protein [Candidatus Omnitrophota bacterium]